MDQLSIVYEIYVLCIVWDVLLAVEKRAFVPWELRARRFGVYNLKYQSLFGE
jgi:glycopeptide antibiotics resistance protein